MKSEKSEEIMANEPASLAPVCLILAVCYQHCQKVTGIGHEESQGTDKKDRKDMGMKDVCSLITVS